MSAIELRSGCAPTRLTREHVPILLEAINNPQMEEIGAWNVVESIELLIDAGQYKAGRTLADTVYRLVHGDGRQRLFSAYSSLCEVLIEGSFSRPLKRLSVLCEEISRGNHSVADRIRAGLVYARALLSGASANALRESALHEARVILNEEFNRAIVHKDYDLACLVGLELCASYLLCSPQEIVVLHALVSHLRDIAADEGVNPELRFDIQRIAYHLLPHASNGVEALAAMEDLRRMAQPLGATNQGLAELAISRRSDIAEDHRSVARKKALALLERHKHVAGAFEVLNRDGLDALAKRAFDKAAPLFAQALAMAEDSGYGYGLIIGSVGALQATLGSGDQKTFAVHLMRLENLMESDVTRGSAGLSTVAAMQMAGYSQEAGELAARCERFFHKLGLGALESQAVFMLGSAHALKGRWSEAKKAWKRGIAIDNGRQAPLAAAEKRTAFAQAVAMEGFAASATISEQLMSKVKKLLLEADRSAKGCGETVEAIRVRGRILQTHAQLCMIGHIPVDAVKYLSRARELYSQYELERDVALADALLGLAMLEVAKLKGDRLYEEAAFPLQRALEFFSAGHYAHIRWKLKYYLAIASLMSSRSKSEIAQRDHGMRTASRWLKGALDDLSSAELVGAGGGGIEGEFSPGLSVQALESLSAVLGRKGKSGRARLPKAITRSKRAQRQIH